jgi:hypothetical protein
MMTENNWFPHVSGTLWRSAISLGPKALFSEEVSVSVAARACCATLSMSVCGTGGSLRQPQQD